MSYDLDDDLPVELGGDLHRLGRIFEERLASPTGSAAPSPAPSRAALSRDERTALLARFGDLVRRLSSLMKITDAQRGPISLDTVLTRLMAIVTDALDADRGTLFLHDRESDELFSRVVEGGLVGEIRIGSGQGIAGLVYTTGEALVIDDAYADSRFNAEIDRETGYRTRNILCVPIRNWDGKVIGVTEVLNKRSGAFDDEDRVLLEALTSHAAAALESSQLYESFAKALRDEAQLLGITAALSSELHLDALLDKIMAITTEVLDADRSTLFLHDAERRELWSKVAEGMDERSIRIAEDEGIAGAVFSSGETINIADAYSDGRFNPEVDRVTGYRTRSILCVPVVTNEGRVIGVVQALNKRGGPFNARDEKRLHALAAQAAIALENARLFEDVLNARNYSESILKSLSNGVVTLDCGRHIIKANRAALRILGEEGGRLLGRTVDEAFAGANRWVVESLARAENAREPELALDADIVRGDGDTVSVNLTIEPLIDIKERLIGFMLIFEDITSEKRVKSTMARYMDRELADRLLAGGESILGGQTQDATVLFTDIHSFTGLSEQLGARDTVSMLNEYFSDMVEVVFEHHGILDKYIGDALMAVFGTPFPGPEDADNAVAAAVEMLRVLEEFNRRRALAGQAPIDIRLGVSSGEVVAGNIGSPKRMDYTVIGDSVNVAARLESANKFYGTRVLVSEDTVRRLRRGVAMRELDLIRVKGRVRPIAIYEVLDGATPDGRPRNRAALDAFAAGFDDYRAREWRAALGHFTRALELDPADRPTRLFLERSRHYLRAPPGAEWDGVWVLTEK